MFSPNVFHETSTVHSEMGLMRFKLQNLSPITTNEREKWKVLNSDLSNVNMLPRTRTQNQWEWNCNIHEPCSRENMGGQ